MIVVDHPVQHYQAIKDKLCVQDFLFYVHIRHHVFIDTLLKIIGMDGGGSAKQIKLSPPMRKQIVQIFDAFLEMSR